MSSQKFERNDLTTISLSQSCSITYQNNLPMYEGWLQKKANRFFSPWQWRYYRLNNRRLMYFKNQNQVKPKWTLDFDQITVALEIFSNFSPPQLHISSIGNLIQFKIRLDNYEELHKWYQLIQQHIDSSLGRLLTICPFSNISKYWKEIHLTNSQFRQQVATGDILLFRSKNFGAFLQRQFTGSRYDHVALLIRYNNGSIGVMEATSSTGVTVITWNDFIIQNIAINYSKIAYRRLEFECSNSQIEGIKNFVENVQGKQYSLSFKKIIKMHKNVIPGQENTFFCSELVASALKSMELLPAHIPSCNYWPKDFQEGSKLNMLGCALSQEFIIDL